MKSDGRLSGNATNKLSMDMELRRRIFSPPFATCTLESLFTITVAIISVLGATLRRPLFLEWTRISPLLSKERSHSVALRPTENGTLPQAAYADEEDELDVLDFDIIIYIYILIVANNWLF